MTLDYCCRLPKWQAVKRRSLRYSTCRMGNSRKYPYYTMDGFYILTPSAHGFLKCIIPPCPQNSMIVRLLPVWIFAFSKAFSRNTLVSVPRGNSRSIPPHHALGVPIVSIPPPPPACFCIPCLALGIPLSHPWYRMDIF